MEEHSVMCYQVAQYCISDNVLRSAEVSYGYEMSVEAVAD